MSVPGYGRITPLQGFVLGLGGEVIDLPFQTPTDEQRLAEMKASRKELRAHTSKDFGFDLAAWHNYLMQHPDFAKEYTFDYAWSGVSRKVKELIDDPNRIRLARILDGQEPDFG